MKKIILLAVFGLLATSSSAENLQKVVFTSEPKMVCQNCENNIKKTARFVKGTKQIETSLADQTITIIYDADKAKPADYEKALLRIKRQLKVVQDPVPYKADTPKQ
ncbi:MAG: heavy-metal-associated domain-containing protein [Bacteroidales bacterium]|nr:heavy-metal-associated domain-containing protein [Bacteroidales bacterium]